MKDAPRKKTLARQKIIVPDIYSMFVHLLELLQRDFCLRKVDVKERIIAERDNVIKDLQEQLEQQNIILIQRQQQADKSTDEDGDQESGNEVNAEVCKHLICLIS